MLEVTVYETHDGERFDNYDDACYHEANLDFAVIAEKVKFFDDCVNPMRFDDFDDFKRKCHRVCYITGAISLLDEFLGSESPTEEDYGYWIDWPYNSEGFPFYDDGDVLAVDENNERWVNYSQQFEEIRNTIRKVKG
jgi:hypothetical protein